MSSNRLAAAAGAVLLTGAMAFVATSGDSGGFSTLSASDPVSVSFDCSNAAYVDQALPASNFGTDATLQINGGGSTERRSYVQCDVDLPPGAVIESADLQLYAVVAANSSIQLKSATAAFNESTLNWNSRPSLGAAVMAERNLAGLSGTSFTMAVTDIVGNGNYRYAVVPKSTATLAMTLASDDDTTPAHRPVLNVTYHLPSVRAWFQATPSGGGAPLAVTFTDASDGAITGWSWNFGDGATSTTQSPTHTYTSPGIYWATLTVSNAVDSFTTGQYVTAQWTTIVNDKFEFAGLPAHWSPYDGPFGSGSGSCAAPSQVQTPGDGSLHLVMQYSPTAVCSGVTGVWLTGGVQISSASGFRSDAGGNQAIEVRYRIVRDDTSNTVRSHYILPMHWPTTGTGFGGESDYCEGGISLTTCTTFLHYGDGTLINSKGHTGIDLSNWTTVRAERLNHTVKVYFNGTLFYTFTGDTTTLPDKILAGVLQQECPNSGCPAASFAAYTEDIQIDYVKIENPS